MSKHDFFPLPLWDRFSKKMKGKLDTLRSTGRFSEKEAEERSYLFGSSSVGSLDDGNVVTLTFLIDPKEGIIADGKYCGFCDAAMLALCEIVIPFTIGKTIAQVNRFTKDLLIKQAFDNEEFPSDLDEHIELLLEGVKKGVVLEGEFPFNPPTPLAHEPKQGERYPDFGTLSKEEKLRVIEEVFDLEIRPYVALDEGGVKILDLQENELSISYEGSCTSCHSSIGSTLSAIQNILQEKLDESLVVVPNMDNFKF